MRIDYLAELNEEQRRAVEHGVETGSAKDGTSVAHHCWCRWAYSSRALAALMSAVGES